ncbi:response regulator transcription factor, partial [Candidatus Woesebacteria bacterium]|nr:response regulator transcription factor [Candidatus Woesebacteria bacterium]
QYGTRASFELCKKNDSVITIYLRADAEMYDLVFSILSALLRPTLMQRHHNTWAEAQLLVDWIISDTVLGTVFSEIGCDDYKTLLSNIRSGYDGDTIRVSKEIYEQLEIGREQTEFYILRNEVLHNGKKISNLSFGEQRILMSLIENREGVVTYETIASLILQKEEAFSLYSISKRIQRLRDKLEEAGIGKHHIQTVRGVGFRIH